MPKKRALITGVGGQDGAYLAKFLLEKNYHVTGGARSIKPTDLWRLNELKIRDKLEIIKFELNDKNIINNVIKDGKYYEIYNLAAQSFVDKSYINPIDTSNSNAIAVVYILEAIRKFSKKTKFYQASSSEMYGNIKSKIQNEKTNFLPVSPYAVSKLYAHYMVSLYRDAYNLYCCSGILFNHESPLRSEEFVTKKIISQLIKVKLNLLPHVKLGNIYAKRDWGYSTDYVEAMWKMLQLKNADDFVISSGNTHTVKDFVIKVAKYLDLKLYWLGKGINEVAVNKQNNKIIIKIDKKYFRPNDIKNTFGNSEKAKKILKWKPATSFDKLVEIMCEAELDKYK